MSSGFSKVLFGISQIPFRDFPNSSSVFPKALFEISRDPFQNFPRPFSEYSKALFGISKGSLQNFQRLFTEFSKALFRIPPWSLFKAPNHLFAIYIKFFILQNHPSPFVDSIPPFSVIPPSTVIPDPIGDLKLSNTLMTQQKQGQHSPQKKRPFVGKISYSGDGRTRTAVQTPHQTAFYTLSLALVFDQGLPPDRLPKAYPLDLSGT